MLLPISLDVKGKLCLVVGGGIVAARKVRSLLECEAKVHVVARDLCDDLESLQSQIEYSKRAFQSGDCAQMQLVFACTNVRKVNAEVAQEARRLGTWCNIADDSANSDFHGAATIRRGDISIAISTQGGSPALSKHLKAKIEDVIGDEYSELLSLMSARRATIEYSNSQNERADRWRTILESDVLELLRRGENERAVQRMDEILNESVSN